MLRYLVKGRALFRHSPRNRKTVSRRRTCSSCARSTFIVIFSSPAATDEARRTGGRNHIDCVNPARVAQAVASRVHVVSRAERRYVVDDVDGWTSRHRRWRHRWGCRWHRRYCHWRHRKLRWTWRKKHDDLSLLHIRRWGGLRSRLRRRLRNRRRIALRRRSRNSNIGLLSVMIWVKCTRVGIAVAMQPAHQPHQAMPTETPYRRMLPHCHEHVRKSEQNHGH